MHRRDMLRGCAAAAAAVAVGGVARAAVVDVAYYQTQIGPLAWRRAFVPRPALVQQECEEWCWAASIAMIFDSLGHPIDQKTIVAANFGGGLSCAPAAAPIAMARNLSARWIDANGVPFTSQVTAAYDPQSGYRTLGNYVIVNELAAERPLLYSNAHHAMAIVSVDYIDSPLGPDVRALGVLDPWPATLGYRQLTGQDIVAQDLGGEMAFVASVAVA